MMKRIRQSPIAFNLLLSFAITLMTVLPSAQPMARADDAPNNEAGQVRAANLIYGTNMTSVCFADDFLSVVEQKTNIQTHREFSPVAMEADELFEFPYAVMTGEGNFTLSAAQRDGLRDYLMYGGFLVASSGCSSRPWNHSFQQEMDLMFPDAEFVKLDADHPIFHTVYDITSSRYRRGGAKLPELYAMEIDGRVVMIWSPDGLNDSGNAGGNCCCCGGNEIKSAKELNINILAYALTH